jgi:hypothetical protein
VNAPGADSIEAELALLPRSLVTAAWATIDLIQGRASSLVCLQKLMKESSCA